MSHFTVLVITTVTPTMETLTRALAPFHEFECTGDDNQYVQNVDETAEAKAEYQAHIKDLLPEEVDNVGPEAEWIADYYGRAIIPVGTEPDTDDRKYRYGWIEADADNNVIKVIRRTNPNAEWDWWQLGGRWSGMLIPKTGTSGRIGKPGVIIGKPGVMGTTHPNAEIGGVDSLRKGDLNLEHMRNEAELRARKEWTEARAIIDPHLQGFQTWDTVRAKYATVGDASIEYHRQPLMQAINKSRLTNLLFGGPDQYLVDEDTFAAKARASAFVTFAVLDARNGEPKWIERGWFAHVSNEKEDWPEQFARLLDSIDPDHYISVVDCHI